MDEAVWSVIGIVFIAVPGRRVGESPRPWDRRGVADLYRGRSSTELTLAGDRLQALAALGPAPTTGLASAVAPSALGADDDGGRKGMGSYIAGRIGPMWFYNDLEDLDTGLNAEIAFGIRPIRFLAIEFQSGFMWGEGDGGDAEFWSVPVVVNAKAIIPLFFLEIYGGLGIGGYYTNTEASGTLLSGDDQDFVFGWNAFLGAGFTLGDLALGLEAKYIQTEDFDAPGATQAKLEGLAVMAYLTFYFWRASSKGFFRPSPYRGRPGLHPKLRATAAASAQIGSGIGIPSRGAPSR